MSVYRPCNPNIGDLLAVAVVDQRHAHILQGEAGLLFGQLHLLALAQHLVDGPLLCVQHHPLEAFKTTAETHFNTL